MQVANDIPFYRTLRFKLFASYCTLLLLTSLITLVVHVRGVASQMETFFEGDFMPFAVTIRNGMIQRLEAGQSVEPLLYEKQETTPYKILYVPFLPGEPRSGFRLSEEEKAELEAGDPLRGSALDRLDGWGTEAGQPGFRRMQPNNFVALPIEVQGRTRGAVVVFDMKPNPQFRRMRMASSAGKAMAVVLLLAVLAAFLLSRHLTKPLRRMKQFAQDFSQGKLSARTGLHRQDELGILARAFDDMAEQIESNTTTRNRMLSDVSHELGTPVATIRATLEAILDDLLPPEEHRDYLQSSLDQLEHLSHIVNDVTDLSRFESGRISLEVVPFQARIPVERAVEAARALADKKGIRIETLPNESAEVSGDLHRVTQVLKNLVMNAVQHNPQGTHVVAGWDNLPDVVVFSVRDDGPPVPQAHASHIFERFYKASESRTRDGSSSGLGLAIVRRILQEHGSDVEFSQDNDGKGFVFRLPRR